MNIRNFFNKYCVHCLVLRQWWVSGHLNITDNEIAKFLPCIGAALCTSNVQENAFKKIAKDHWTRTTLVRVENDKNKNIICWFFFYSTPNAVFSQ